MGCGCCVSRWNRCPLASSASCAVSGKPSRRRIGARNCLHLDLAHCMLSCQSNMTGGVDISLFNWTDSCLTYLCVFHSSCHRLTFPRSQESSSLLSSPPFCSLLSSSASDLATTSTTSISSHSSVSPHSCSTWPWVGQTEMSSSDSFSSLAGITAFGDPAPSTESLPALETKVQDLDGVALDFGPNRRPTAPSPAGSDDDAKCGLIPVYSITGGSVPVMMTLTDALYSRPVLKRPATPRPAEGLDIPVLTRQGDTPSKKRSKPPGAFSWEIEDPCGGSCGA
jgi:hypothetical protein